MANTVLVTFSTVYGSTQEVAERVAAILRTQGLSVDLVPVKHVKSLDPYSAVVLGAPLYMFHWHKDAMGFLSKKQKAFAQKPLAIFALGPINNEQKEFEQARTMLDKDLSKFSWLAPVDIEIIGGKMEPAKFRFPHNLIPAMNKMPASDIRDWTAITAWASSLADKLRLAQS